MADMTDSSRYGQTTSSSGSGWAIAEGVVLLIIGIVAVFSPFATAAAAAILFPLYLVVKGILELIAAFRARTAGRAFWDVAFGIVAIIAGILLFARPAISGLTLAVLLIAYFVVDGIVRIVVSLAQRSQAWGWVLASGIIDLILAAYLIAQPPTVTLFVLGFLLGISIISAGAVLIAEGSAERSHATGGGMAHA
jgi:uncharacterized membrane protein HdeD (DUF308 family)